MRLKNTNKHPLQWAKCKDSNCEHNLGQNCPAWQTLLDWFWIEKLGLMLLGYFKAIFLTMLVLISSWWITISLPLHFTETVIWWFSPQKHPSCHSLPLATHQTPTIHQLFHAGSLLSWRGVEVGGGGNKQAKSVQLNLPTGTELRLKIYCQNPNSTTTQLNLT